ncbi:MAG TPA: type II secretion system protein GspK [Candidatus Sumerlaeota bacterium]|nr:type II secretion system protein GspK [Candidatus Sumerlaeota bacterium]HOR28255.1 type II secretion system protein GspK [Candidatus Sumerlaeota bacterium]
MRTRKHTRLQPGHGSRGVILVMVLWIIVVLSVMAYSLAYEMRVGLKTTSLAQKRLAAGATARAGLAKAVTDLKNDRLIALADQGQTNDNLMEVWADKEDKTDVEFGGGTFTVRIIDEESKLDVNSIIPASMPGLVYLLREVGGFDDDEAQIIAACIVDFADADLIPSTGEGYDEVEYYTEWGLDEYGDQLPPGWVFRPKNDYYLHIEELLEIPGLTREMLYGDPREVPQDPFVRRDEEEDFPALADYLTAGRNHKVNINTARIPVLEAIFAGAMGEGGDYGRIVSRIDDLRRSRNTLEGGTGYGIADPAQLAEAGVPAEAIELVQQLFPLGVQSHRFTIIARGTYQGVRETIAATVNLTVESYPYDPDDPDTFGLRDQAAAGELENQPYVKVDPAVRVEWMAEL